MSDYLTDGNIQFIVTVCDACGYQDGLYRGIRYIPPVTARHSIFPWRRRQASPAYLRAQCTKCDKIHRFRPGTVRVDR